MSRKAQATPSFSSDAASARATPEDRWAALFGSPPPRSASLIAQAVAWQEQVLEHGDVSPAVKRDLAIAAHQAKEARSGETAVIPPTAGADPSRHASIDISSATVLPPASSQLVPGARLVKVHGGKTHVVEVTKAGMIYEGETYASLSAVAKVITGTHWNGLLFFGLRKRKVYPAKAVAHG